MADTAHARKLAFGKRISDLLADEEFAASLPRTETGEFSLIIADWDDSMSDVFKHIHHVDAPATLLLSRGDSFLEFTLALPSASPKRAGVYSYDPHEPLRDFLVHVMEHGGVFLNFPEPTVLPSHRQLYLDFERIAS